MIAALISTIAIALSVLSLNFSKDSIVLALQPSLEVFILLVSTIFLLFNIYLGLLRPVTPADYRGIVERLSATLIEVYIIFQLVNTPLYQTLLVYILMFIVKITDAIIYRRVQLLINNELTPRATVRLVYAAIIGVGVLATGLYHGRDASAGLAVLFYYEALFHCIHIVLTMFLLFMPIFHINQSKTNWYIVIFNFISATIKLVIQVITCITFFKYDPLFIQAVPTSFSGFIEFVRALKQLHTSYSFTKFHETHFNEPELCVICQMTTETGVKLPCGHSFHKDCISNWVSRSNRCPICQQDIKKPKTQAQIEDEMVQQWLVVETDD